MERLRGIPVVCVLAALVLAACSGVDIDQEHRRTVSYDVGGAVRTLVVKGRTGEVQVTGGGSSVGVTEAQDYRSSPPRTTHDTSGGTLTLTYDCSDCGVGYDVHVPAGTAVNVTDDTGSVTLRGLAGPVRANTGTGDVTAEGLSSAQARLTAETGDVSVGFGSAPTALYAAAGTGNVGVTVPGNTAYAVSAGADTGDVRVSVATTGNGAHSITARAQTGDVTVGTS